MAIDATKTREILARIKSFADGVGDASVALKNTCNLLKE